MPNYDDQADDSVDRGFKTLMDWLERQHGDDENWDEGPDYDKIADTFNRHADGIRSTRSFDQSQYRMQMRSVMGRGSDSAISSSMSHLNRAKDFTQKAASEARRGARRGLNRVGNKLARQARRAARAQARRAMAKSARAMRMGRGRGGRGGRR